MKGRSCPPGQPASASSAGRQRGNRRPSELERLDREIASTDAEIDNWFTTCLPAAAGLRQAGL